jgi:hypothetical protein
MHLKSAAALCFGLVIFGLAAAPADAQTRQRVVVGDGTRYMERGEDGRVRTRIVIQRRSFLDGGTEVLPGSQRYTDYVHPYGSSPLNVVEGTNIGRLRWPLPGPYDLAGKDNPYLFQ